MKLLTIRIPLAAPRQIVDEADEPAARRAAYEEMCTLIPGLSNLKSSEPRFGMNAQGDQIFLTVTLLPMPQLQLRLSDADMLLGRIVEQDSSVVDQAVVKSSLVLTRDLLAAAGQGEPQAIREWLERQDKKSKSHAVKKLRRLLGRQYEVDVFAQPETVYLPDMSLTRLAAEQHTVSVIVSQMKKRRSFWASHLVPVGTDIKSAFNFDPREVWTFVRRGEAQIFTSGQILHESMERNTRALITGRFVYHTLTDSPVAMEAEIIQVP